MRRRGLKNTSTRKEVFEVLCQAGKPLLLKEIAARANASHPSSVYRTLPLFEKCKIARKVSIGFKTLYELGDNFTNHQHYVVCEECGRIIRFKDSRLEYMAHKITLAAGMEPTGHFIELSGICEQCQQKMTFRDKITPCSSERGSTRVSYNG
ncbi:MAG: transcriptional repressor [Candidatus Nomurabacteria bacterium]|nr:transcriptional repressor [Candidatus Nomurabacteria bacterium]